jgi:hypothetical protein
MSRRPKGGTGTGRSSTKPAPPMHPRLAPKRSPSKGPPGLSRGAPGGAPSRLNPQPQENADLAQKLASVPQDYQESPPQQADRERFQRLNAAFAQRGAPPQNPDEVQSAQVQQAQGVPPLT